MHNYEDIENIVDRYALEYLGESFQFRKYQKEAIIDIILNILNHEHRNYIVEARFASKIECGHIVMLIIGYLTGAVTTIGVVGVP